MPVSLIYTWLWYVLISVENGLIQNQLSACVQLPADEGDSERVGVDAWGVLWYGRHHVPHGRGLSLRLREQRRQQAGTQQPAGIHCRHEEHIYQGRCWNVGAGSGRSWPQTLVALCQGCHQNKNKHWTLPCILLSLRVLSCTIWGYVPFVI